MTPRLRAFALSLALAAAPARALADANDWPDAEGAVAAQVGAIQKAPVRAQSAAAVGTAPAAAAAPGACDPAKTNGAPQNLDAPVPTTDGASRLAGRGFPSVFEAWSNAERLDLAPFGGVTALSEDPDAAIARHDVAILGDWSLGLKPLNNCTGLGVGYAAGSIAKGLSNRAAILSANPNAVLLMAVHYFDAADGYLPADSPWWLRVGGVRSNDNGSNPKKPSSYYHLDYHNPDFRAHVALQCKAAVLSGVYDGCFFDWWSEDDDRVKLLQAVRKEIGDGPLIVVNVNNRRPDRSASLINGIYMEGFNSFFWHADAAGWDAAFGNLRWAAQNLRPPALTLLEGWFTRSRSDLGDIQMMRALTALSLTQSNGAVLFGDPDNIAEHDHLHDWYPFWNRDKDDPGLGRPTGAAALQPDGSWRREFERGEAVYNPPANKPVTVVFSDGDRTSRATHKRGRSHAMLAGDGDIFLK